MHRFQLDLVDDDGQGCGAVVVSVPDESMLDHALEDICIMLYKIVKARVKGETIHVVETSIDAERAGDPVDAGSVPDASPDGQLVQIQGQDPSETEGTTS